MKNLKTYFFSLVLIVFSQTMLANPFFGTNPTLPNTPNTNTTPTNWAIYASNFLSGKNLGCGDAAYVLETYYYDAVVFGGGNTGGLGDGSNPLVDDERKTTKLPYGNSEAAAISFWQGYLINAQAAYNNAVQSGNKASIEYQRGVLEGFHFKMIYYSITYGITYTGSITTYTGTH